VTVLVTGGAGYIGSITVRAIRASGRAVVVLDTLENGHRAPVGDTPFVQGDIADAELVERSSAPSTASTRWSTSPPTRRSESR